MLVITTNLTNPKSASGCHTKYIGRVDHTPCERISEHVKRTSEYVNILHDKGHAI